MAEQGVVTIEAPRNRFRSQEQIGPGVVERTTCRLLVSYRLNLPPVFNLVVRRSTGVTREIGYAIVGGLEKLKWRLPMFLEQPRHPERPGRLRRGLRRMRVALAVWLLLPRFEEPAASLSQSEDWDQLPSPGFEAYRRVFEFREENGERTCLLMCHVFAELHEDAAASQLLEKFAVIAGRTVEMDSTIYLDGPKQLCLQGRPSGRIGSRRYWEVIIGASGRFPRSPGAPTGLIAQEGFTLEDVNQQDLPEVEDQRFEMPNADLLKGAIERSSVDWNFLTGEIRAATERDEPLDDSFIQALAARRLEHARREFPMEEPGATLESSLRIVRNAVVLHQMAATGEAPEESASDESQSD
jgi:hypothetical protein